jgi:hypothetical protein
MRSFLI